MLSAWQGMILRICCVLMISGPAFAADQDDDVVMNKLAAAVESKSIDPSRLNVLAAHCVRLKLHAAVPLRSGEVSSNRNTMKNFPKGMISMGQVLFCC